MQQRTGKTPPELIGPDLPSATEHIWQWFQELGSKRIWSDTGPQPIQDAGIHAWARLTGRCPRYWELLALWRLDHAYRQYVNANRRDRERQESDDDR